MVPIRGKNFITGRYEWSRRDELFANNPEFAEQLATATGAQWFNVNAYTIGYTRDLGVFSGVQTGLGANISLYGIPVSIKACYGDHPMGFNVYLCIRLR